MKKVTQKFLIGLVLGVMAMPGWAQEATPTSFTPVPVGESSPLRFFVNLQANTQFADDFSPTGKYAMENGQLNLGLIYNVGMGLDVGFGLHGGMYSEYGFFATPNPALVSPYKQYGAMFGADIMVRYLAMFSDMFYGGIQAQVGYNYTDTKPGAPDSYYTTAADGYVAYSSKGAWNSFIPVVAGVVLGMDFKDAATFYLFPAIELGQTPNGTNTTMPVASNQDTGVWKSAVGMQFAVGTAINLGMTKLVIEVKPRVANFSNKNSWGLDATLGAFWDF